MQAQRRGGHAPLDALQTDAQITRQHHIGGTAIHTAVQGANGDGAQRSQRIGNFFKERRPMTGLVETTNVITRAKHRLGLTRRVGGQHQHTHIRLVVDAFKMRQQSLEVTVFQTIALGWTVQGDGGHAAFDVQNRGRGLGQGR